MYILPVTKKELDFRVIEWIISGFSLPLFGKVFPFFPPLWQMVRHAHHPELVEGEGLACLREALRRRQGEIL